MPMYPNRKKRTAEVPIGFNQVSSGTKNYREAYNNNSLGNYDSKSSTFTKAQDLEEVTVSAPRMSLQEWREAANPGQNAIEMQQSNLNLPSTDMRRRDVISPNQKWMAGQRQGEGVKSQVEFHENVMGLAAPMAPVKAFGNVIRSGKMIPGKKNVVKNIDFGKYITPQEAATARAERMLAQESKWRVNNPDKVRLNFNNISENFQEIPAGSIGKSPQVLGTNAGGKAIVFSDSPLSQANKSRVAAHETGHYYRNSAEEADRWNSLFDFEGLGFRNRTKIYLKGKPTASSDASLSMPTRGLNLRKKGVPHGDELRERAAQLKDYVAQKNNIPLNKDFEITKPQLDDALQNYIKDTGLDNTMTPFIQGLKNKGDIEGFLKMMNKSALSLSPIAGVAGYQNKNSKIYPTRQ